MINLQQALLTEIETSHYIGMSRSFLRQARMLGKKENGIPPPKFIKLGKRSVRYVKEDLDDWIAQFQKLNHLSEIM